MIRYALKCAAGHGFESWFADAGAYEALLQAGQLTCPICGDAQIDKALMAPSVRPARKAEARAEAGSPPVQPGALSAPNAPQEQALAALRRKIEENSEYVGADFATEARRMHEGDSPERAIHGEAKLDEARRLIEDGIPVVPLPFLPPRKTN